MTAELGPGSVRKLEVWQEGIAIAKAAYLLCRTWPKEEAYGLTSQVKRAAISIMANLAEGVGRGSPGEAIQFAQIALGSVYDLDTLLQFSCELGIADHDDILTLRDRLTVEARRISSFIAYKRTKKASNGAPTR